MRLLKKPNPWGCSITSFAMALDVSVETLQSYIGHDGSEIVFPELPEPMCRRGFHQQELIFAALNLGWTVTPFELVPAIQSTPVAGFTPKVITLDSEDRRLMFAIMVRAFRGVLTGLGSRCHHAVAFDRGAVYDPDGATYSFSFPECERRRFIAQCVWLVRPLGA